jgi:hypothetical protein
MGKKMLVFGCDDGLDEYGRDILVLDVFTMGFIKKNTDNMLPVIGVGRTLRKDDSIDGSSLYTALGGSGYLNIKIDKKDARERDQNEKGKDGDLKFSHILKRAEGSLAHS